MDRFGCASDSAQRACVQVLSFLDAPNLCNFRVVSKGIRSLIDQEQVRVIVCAGCLTFMRVSVVLVCGVCGGVCVCVCVRAYLHYILAENPFFAYLAPLAQLTLLQVLCSWS